LKSVQKIDLGLTGYDELFMNDAERKENKLPRIYDIPLSEIDDFPDHPFKVKLDEDMDQLVQSIKERGIITLSPSDQRRMGGTRLCRGIAEGRLASLPGLIP
jgi:ParB family chromosome partitioning protein